MRHIYITILGVLLGISGLHAQDFMAGAAVRDITPQPLLPVSGGVGTPRPAHIQKGNLTVRAMVLADGEERVAIVSIDNLGWPALLGDESRKLIEGIPPENILIGATHTHSAPEAYGFRDENGELTSDPQYLAYCIQQIADAIREAQDNLQPAYLKIGVDEAAEQIAFNYYAPELYDPRCGVIQAIHSENNDVIATLVNYAIHPEVIGPKQGILSPDLCGPLYDAIETKVGGTAIFMNGALGGMVTADNRRPNGQQDQTWEECQRIGKLLADEALRIVQSADPQPNPELKIHAETITFPVTSPLMQQIMNDTELGNPAKEGYFVQSTLAMVDIGSARILTIPGEALPNIGYYLKRKMNVPHPFLFGLTNDAYGYILTKEDFNSFDRYAYITRTSLGEHTGDILIETYENLLQKYPKNFSSSER